MVQKIVVNKCYGGFGLSDEAVKLYAQMKGFKVYIENDGLFSVYWTKPPSERHPPLEGKAWIKATDKQRIATNKAYDQEHFTPRDLERTDPILVEVVEKLGEKANSKFSELEVTEVPEDVKWQIEEYDGREWISEVHRTW